MNRWIALFSSLLFCLPPCVLAQGWRPDKAVEIVIGAAPGGANDRIGRSLQRLLQDGRANQITTPVNVEIGRAHV